MSCLDLIKPVKEGVKELWVVVQPGSVESQVERSSVLIEVSVEVVNEKVIELVPVQNT